MDMIDAIVEYNQGKWGGRFNPIILTDGKSIDEQQWQFLRAYDPDVIRLTTSVEGELLERMECFFSPYLVEAWKPIREAPLRVGIHTEGLSIFPSKKGISRITGDTADDPRLAAFYVNENVDTNIRRFIVHNFGRYKHYLYLDRVIKEVPKRVFEIDSCESLDDALKELANSKPMNPFVYPIQLCCSAYSNQRTKYAGQEEEFAVIVGDSADNVAYCWNRGFFMGNAVFPRINQIWLPKALAANPTIIESLTKFLQETVWKTNAGAQRIHFWSSDIADAELSEIARIITPQYFISSYHAFSKTRVPIFERHYWNADFKAKTDLHRATGKDTQFVIDEPKIIEGPKHGEHWMADLYIEHVSDTYRNYRSNLGFWWKLPNRNRLAWSMFNQASRICSNGIPSVLVNRDNPVVRIHLTDDISLFRILILTENTPALTIDARQKSAKKPFDDLRRSDKGRYLSGILDLLSGLTNASHFLGERYWREIFKRLSGQESVKEERTATEIRNRLMKWINKSGDFKNQEHALDSLTSYTMHVARQHGIRGKELTYRDFLQTAVSELKSFLIPKDNLQLLDFRFGLDPGLEKDLSDNKLSRALEDAFRENDILLSRKAEISVIKQGSKWLLADESNGAILVVIKDDGLKVYEYAYDEKDLKEEMSNLTESNVLLTGIRPNCPFCGSAYWYHIDEATQHLRCKGCRYEYSMPANQEWFYKLNTLVQAGCFEHGLIPVILVLGELLLHPGVCFFYAPCLEIFEEYGGEPYGDLDIVCIQDGKFIIGEIKQSVKLFKPDDFTKMGEIAERILPDEVLFSSMDGQPNTVVKAGIANLKEQLSPREIDVKWHALHSTTFEASRVMFNKCKT